MAKKMISALKEMVGEGEDFQEKIGKIRSALMNENRLAVFQFLCRVPGCSINAISDHTGLSTSTVKWHLQKLMIERYVVVFRAGNRMAYFPKGMVEERFMKVLSILNEHMPMTILWILLKTPGMTQKELRGSLGAGIQPARLAIGKLERSNIVLAVIDGRFRRYYPSGELRELTALNRKKVRQFKALLLRRFDDELLNPKMVLSKSGESLIEISIGQSKNRIQISSDISASVISYYGKMIEGDKHDARGRK
jgi:predicted transcriptional regulator